MKIKRPLAVSKPPPPKVKEDDRRHWKDILSDANFPTDLVVLDFETFFSTDYSLKKLDTISYIMGSQFEVLGMSLARSCEGFKPEWCSGWAETEIEIEELQNEYGLNLEDCTVVAHNARFDCAVLKWRYGISPKYIVDTLGLANHWDSRAKNSLKEMSKRAGLPDKGDTLNFKDWTYRDQVKKKGGRGKDKNLMVPLPKITLEMDKQLGEYAKRDVDNTWELFKWYLPRMSNPSTELHVNNHTLHLYLDPVFNVDVERGEDIKKEMGAELEREIAATGHTQEEISRDSLFEPLMVAALRNAKVDPALAMKPAKNKAGQKLAIAKSDKTRGWVLTHEDKTVRTLMKAKAALKSWPNHMSRIDSIIRQYENAGHTLPVPLGYHGAHTGRWSGGEGINLQNLGSRGHKLISRIRTMLVAPYGHTLVIVDASQIEARVLAWEAGDTVKCDKFRNNEELYCAFATKVLGQSVREPRDEGIPEIEAWHEWARNSVGKVGELGCGYGMGAAKAVAYSGETLDFDTAKKVVDTWRAENPSITKFWRRIEKKFIYTAKYGKPCTLEKGLLFRQTPECKVIITLPSGRELKYHQVNIKPYGKYGQDVATVYNGREKKWAYIWGGTLTENVVQAISRDILWGAIARLESWGVRVIHHIHDELVAVTTSNSAKQVLEWAMDALTLVPDWAKGLPLGAKGIITTRYGSH